MASCFEVLPRLVSLNGNENRDADSP